MARIVNIKKLFEVIDKPVDCDFTIKVEDELIKENNLSLRVTAEACYEWNGNVDLEVNIRGLSQLAVGSTGLDEALLRDDVKVNGNLKMLKKVFTEKKIFVSENF